MLVDDTDRLVTAANRLWAAAATGTACAPVRDLIGSTDLRSAYAVQRLNLDRAVAGGARVTGRKVGLTSAAVQDQLGVGEPDFGTLLDTMVFSDGAVVTFDRLLQPRVEGEVAVVLGADLADEVTPRTARAAVAYVVPAIEVVDSRIAGWDITIADTVADNASSGVVVLGARPRRLNGLDLRLVEMSLTRNGAVSSTGTGAACLGDPLHALVWLARAARDLGVPLRAGELVLTGALGPVVPVAPGDEITVACTGLGSVRARFAAGTPG